MVSVEAGTVGYWYKSQNDKNTFFWINGFEYVPSAKAALCVSLSCVFKASGRDARWQVLRRELYYARSVASLHLNDGGPEEACLRRTHWIWMHSRWAEHILTLADSSHSHHGLPIMGKSEKTFLCLHLSHVSPCVELAELLPGQLTDLPSRQQIWQPILVPWEMHSSQDTLCLSSNIT